MRIPDFVDGYHLPRGEHKCTLEEVYQRFGSANASRQRCWESFQMFLTRCKHLGIKPEVIVIDGSFVTAREEIGDIDCAMLINEDELLQALKNADEHDLNAVQFILEKPELTRDLLGVHVFVVFDEIGLHKWSKFFSRIKSSEVFTGRSKRAEEKGVLRVDFCEGRGTECGIG